eukprot:1922040-Alexandrium_andersonii.AAC.1
MVERRRAPVSPGGLFRSLRPSREPCGALQDSPSRSLGPSGAPRGSPMRFAALLGFSAALRGPP